LYFNSIVMEGYCYWARRRNKIWLSQVQ